MSAFSDAEIECLGSQRLGRLATVGQDGMPRAVEVRGQASTIATGGKAIMERFDDPVIRILPRRIVSWGFQARSVG